MAACTGRRSVPTSRATTKASSSLRAAPSTSTTPAPSITTPSLRMAESPVAKGPDLGRHRRWPHPNHARRAARPGPTSLPKIFRNGAASARSTLLRSTREPPTSPSIVTRIDDLHPYIYQDADYGKTWTKITNGIPDNTFVRAVREDPKKRGLLYAGTETGVFVSFNDGADWRPLQLNLPTSPIHDLIVKNDDLVLATHGRSFWILDDLSPGSPVHRRGRARGRPSLHAGRRPTACTIPKRADKPVLRRTESAARRRDLLLRERRARRMRPPSKSSTRQATVIRKYSSQQDGRTRRAARSRRQEAGKADQGRSRPEPLRLGSALRRRQPRPRLLPLGIQRRSPRPARRSRQVSGAPHRGWQDPDRPLEVKLDPRVNVAQADLAKAVRSADARFASNSSASTTPSIRSKTCAPRSTD